MGWAFPRSGSESPTELSRSRAEDSRQSIVFVIAFSRSSRGRVKTPPRKGNRICTICNICKSEQREKLPGGKVLCYLAGRREPEVANFLIVKFCSDLGCGSMNYLNSNISRRRKDWFTWGTMVHSCLGESFGTSFVINLHCEECKALPTLGLTFFVHILSDTFLCKPLQVYFWLCTCKSSVGWGRRSPRECRRGRRSPRRRRRGLNRLA